MELIEKGKLTCSVCRKQKLQKEFIREFKEYKSCNDCSFGAQRTIDDGFKKAFELFNQKLE